ncbi:MAG: hypothetical protein ABGX64_07405, partial [Cycloclasticus sp.]
MNRCIIQATLPNASSYMPVTPTANEIRALISQCLSRDQHTFYSQLKRIGSGKSAEKNGKLDAFFT